MKIINDFNTDYHMHCSNFSDGFHTFDEIVRFAGEIQLREIAITDHSDSMVKVHIENFVYFPSTHRRGAKHYKNVFNDVEVIFGVEADLLSKDGDIDTEIQGVESDFIILSAHHSIYKSDYNTVTEGYINAIKRYGNKIKFIGHPYDTNQLGGYTDMKELVEVCNEYKIPLELNARTINRNRFDEKGLRYMLENADKIIFNSDAHTLHEIRDDKIKAWNFLKASGYIK